MNFRKLMSVTLVSGMLFSMLGCATDPKLDESDTLEGARKRNEVSNEAGTLVAAIAVSIIGASIVASTRSRNNSGINNNQQQQQQSDVRLKYDIHLLTTLDRGMKIYSFKYLWSDTAYVGVMAQDLLANPVWRDAVVTSPNGFYTVNYGALGLKMVTLEEWQARGLASIKSDERVSVTKQPQAVQPAL